MRRQVTLASSTVEEYTKVKPTKKDGNTLRYGPYSDVAPWTLAQLRAHFVNNKPFVAVRCPPLGPRPTTPITLCHRVRRPVPRVPSCPPCRHAGPPYH